MSISGGRTSVRSWPRDAGTCVLISLDPGDDVLGSLEAACRDHDIEDGVVLSGIGTLDRCRLHCVTTTGYPPQEIYPEWRDEPLELVSMAGTIIGGTPHVHATISNVSGAWGGHLEPGCRVLYLAEIAILQLRGPALQRSPDDRGVVRLR